MSKRLIVLATIVALISSLTLLHQRNEQKNINQRLEASYQNTKDTLQKRSKALEDVEREKMDIQSSLDKSHQETQKLKRDYQSLQKKVSTTSVKKTVVATAPIKQKVVTYAGSTVWDKLAQCEASGNWASNTGNGFSGGLQFTQSTWLGYGGGQYAPSAYLATRDEQIQIATKVQAGQGWGAWPQCSQKIGLI